jgi:hypothetical protein
MAAHQVVGKIAARYNKMTSLNRKRLFAKFEGNSPVDAVAIRQFGETSGLFLPDEARQFKSNQPSDQQSG